LLGHFTGHAGAHDLAPDELCEYRRIALFRLGAGTVGETIAEGDDNVIGTEWRELRHLLAAASKHTDK
jgi:hypothetical protein